MQVELQVGDLQKYLEIVIDRRLGAADIAGRPWLLLTTCLMIYQAARCDAKTWCVSKCAGHELLQQEHQKSKVYQLFEAVYIINRRHIKFLERSIIQERDIKSLTTTSTDAATMSGFFTAPASQRKRKRATVEDNRRPRTTKVPSSRPSKKARPTRDASSNESDVDDEENDDDDDNSVQQRLSTPESSNSDDDNEDLAGKRTRLAEQYLEQTRQQVLAEGFDAEDIDRELLAERMGERLDEDSAESKGKLYRWIASDYDYAAARHAQFRADQNCITAIAVSPPYIYTAAKDSTIVKWESSTRSPTASPDTPPSKPRKLLFTKGSSKKGQRGDMQRHTGSILCMVASEDGKFLVTGGQDKTLIVWNPADLTPLRVFAHHRDAVTGLCFRKGTNQLFSASRDRTIKMWSLDELAYVESLFGHQDEVLDVAALQDETCVTVGARDKTARFWRVVEETQLVFRGGGSAKPQIQNHTHSKKPQTQTPDRRYDEGSIERVTMIDNETFVTGSDNGSLSLWSTLKKKAVFTYPLAHGLQPRMKPDEASAEINPDPRVVAEPLPRWITALVSVPYSDLIISGSWDGHVRAWKITEDKRRIEPLGSIGQIDVEDEDDQGISKSAETVKGIVNDLAVFERGDRGQDGLFVAAAVSKEHRLGRWLKTEGRNKSVVFELPKTTRLAAQIDADDE